MTRFFFSLLLSTLFQGIRMGLELRAVLRFLHLSPQDLPQGFWWHQAGQVAQRPVFWAGVLFSSGLIHLALEAGFQLVSTKGRGPKGTRASDELEAHDD